MRPGGRPGTGEAARGRAPGGGGVRLRPERTVWRLARPYLGRLLGAGLLAAGTELAGLALLATATWLLISAAGRPPLDTLTVAIVAVRALAIGRGVLRYTERLAGHDAALRVVTEVRASVFAALAARRTAGTQRSADLLSRVVSDVEAVQDLLLRVLVPGAAAALVGLLAVAGAAAVEPLAGLALAGGLLLAGVALPVLAALLTRRTAARVAPLRGALAGDAVDLTSGAADLAAFGATGAALDRADARARELAGLERRTAAVGWAVDALGVLVAGATSAAVLTVALRAEVPGVLVGVLAVGTLAAVEAALALVGAARHWTRLRTGLTRVADLLRDAPTPTPAPVPAPAPTPAPVPADASRQPADTPRQPIDAARHLRYPARRWHCRVDGVDLRYRRHGPPALDGVSLDLPAGARIAVVGPSGAGKSSLLGVLTGMVRPDRGRVLLDGVDLAELPVDRLPRIVGGLLADAHVFHASIRENLLLGRAGATDDDLAGAAAAAGLLDWVRRQPAGWDTLVGEDGGQLSGGQRQRLLLARALLAAPAGVLVLDEPTEGLDPAAADAVLGSATAHAGPDRTVVLVTHRLSDLDRYDEIVVLDGGRVTDRGDHAELAARPGWYRDQWLRQTGAERDYLAIRS
ncbi:thiol reductant ABC exporter subunit CydC [Micromonospora sp. WMMD1102]|uniref:thiol reductant ABC exporter subunit CydC n=1 Tax=Micromonospora sp. WMMD1102 TaxID=3016105 RepID=UPI0024158D91|nr:thiol reductant ABC exporter subunit CydC [Micromonospora sp. WMMD1102]MDG4784466.1 thiol reductant ABC exporter subunit CydC [Micromonospora sp. WMMD1102]